MSTRVPTRSSGVGFGSRLVSDDHGWRPISSLAMGDECVGRESKAGRAGFDNGEWVIRKRRDAGIPEHPFRAWIDGERIGRTKLLTFASRVGRTDRFPQVLVIASSGYLRIKSGADPNPSLSFGQSLVLGPAVFGKSASSPTTQLFSSPQIQRVAVHTRKLHRNGKGTLWIRIVARDRNRGETRTKKTNQIMDLTWVLALREPTRARTRIGVNGEYTFTERVRPDPTRTAEFQSFRLLQISSMFIDGDNHDVDGFRHRAASGPVEVLYSPAQANSLLPASPSALDPEAKILDSLHTDDVGEPNGNTPSYRIRIRHARGPVSGPLTARAFFNDSQDPTTDNLGLWIHRRPSTVIRRGTTGATRFRLVATADPLPAP